MVACVYVAVCIFNVFHLVSFAQIEAMSLCLRLPNSIYALLLMLLIAPGKLYYLCINLLSGVHGGLVVSVMDCRLFGSG